MKNWKYKITTPEQLKWAVENKWPVKYKKNFGVLVKGQFESSPTHVTNAIILEKEGVPSFFSEEVSVERNGSFSVPKYLYLVPKTVEELKVGDVVMIDRESFTYHGSNQFKSATRVFSRGGESDTFIPYLPENIFPNQENV